MPSSHRQARAVPKLPQASEVTLFGFSVKIRSCLHADSEIHEAKICSSEDLGFAEELKEQ